MRTAFPFSEYYGGSAPPRGLSVGDVAYSPHHWLVVREGKPLGWFPCSRVVVRRVRHPALPRRLSTSTPRTFLVDCPPSCPHRTDSGRTLHTSSSRAPHTDPDPPGFESVPPNEASSTRFSRIPSRLAHRARTIWQYWHDSTLSGRLATHPAIPRNRLPSPTSRCCDSTMVEVSHLHSINTRLMAHGRFGGEDGGQAVVDDWETSVCAPTICTAIMPLPG